MSKHVTPQMEEEFEKEWSLIQKNGLKESALRHEYEEKAAKNK